MVYLLSYSFKKGCDTLKKLVLLKRDMIYMFFTIRIKFLLVFIGLFFFALLINVQINQFEQHTSIVLLSKFFLGTSKADIEHHILYFPITWFCFFFFFTFLLSFFLKKDILDNTPYVLSKQVSRLDIIISKASSLFFLSTIYSIVFFILVFLISFFSNIFSNKTSSILNNLNQNITGLHYLIFFLVIISILFSLSMLFFANTLLLNNITSLIIQLLLLSFTLSVYVDYNPLNLTMTSRVPLDDLENLIPIIGIGTVCLNSYLFGIIFMRFKKYNFIGSRNE